jgi:hypothetical protein
MANNFNELAKHLLKSITGSIKGINIQVNFKFIAQHNLGVSSTIKLTKIGIKEKIN